MYALILPTEALGPRITDRDALQKLLEAKGNAEAVTRLAREIGLLMGWPQADHFHVPVRPGTRREILIEDGQMVAYLASWP